MTINLDSFRKGGGPSPLVALPKGERRGTAVAPTGQLSGEPTVPLQTYGSHTYYVGAYYNEQFRRF